MSEVVDPSASDRLLLSIRQLIRAELPTLTYSCAYEYVIESTDGTTVTCSPTDTTIPLPTLAKVPIRSSVAGQSVTLPATAVGLRCIIVFLNADPTRPVCISVDPIPGALPTARLTDTVVAGIFAGVITSGSGKVSTP